LGLVGFCLLAPALRLFRLQSGFFILGLQGLLLGESSRLSCVGLLFLQD
jgi:hypothetical protein